MALKRKREGYEKHACGEEMAFFVFFLYRFNQNATTLVTLFGSYYEVSNHQKPRMRATGIERGRHLRSHSVDPESGRGRVRMYISGRCAGKFVIPRTQYVCVNVEHLRFGSSAARTPILTNERYHYSFKESRSESLNSLGYLADGSPWLGETGGGTLMREK